MEVTLTQTEMEFLLREVKGEGGFQGLLQQLRNKLDISTGSIALFPKECERVSRYATKYGVGGWEDMLRGAFGRHLPI